MKLAVRSFPVAMLAAVVSCSLVGCKGIDERRKIYAEELGKKVPQGCTVKPSMAALTIECDGASDKKAAVEGAKETIKSECSAIGDLKISSVVVTAKGEGWFESEVGAIAKGNCDLAKR